MIKFIREHQIDAAPEAVWTVLGDFMNIDRFAPEITSVDTLTTGENGIGSQRRCHFANGTSLIEEVISWTPDEAFEVKLSDMAAMPLREARSEVRVIPVKGGSKVVWGFDYRVKYGPIGWLLGQTLMKMMMGKVIDGNLKGLEAEVLGGA